VNLSIDRQSYGEAMEDKMKILTNKDLPILAEIIREVTHKEVMILNKFRYLIFTFLAISFPVLVILKNRRVIAAVQISDGKVFSTKPIRGFDMDFNSSHVVDPWNWQILI
jgi:hypothetical protein